MQKSTLQMALEKSSHSSCKYASENTPQKLQSHKAKEEISE